jgi:hypothetical protein
VPLSGIVPALFPSLVPFIRVDGKTVAGLALFGAFGAWVSLRRRRIWFDFESGLVTIHGPGGFAAGPPTVGALSLVTKEGKRGWQASVHYGACTLLTTKHFGSREEAREKVLDFALALNFKLGMHTLDEQTEGRDDSRTAVTQQRETAESSPWVACLLGAGAVFISFYCYHNMTALINGPQPMWNRITGFASGMLLVLGFAYFAAVFASAMLHGMHKESRTRGRAFTLGVVMAAGLLLMSYLSG